MDRVRRWPSDALGALTRVDPTDLALRLTLLDLLLRPIGPWPIRPILLALAGVGLLAPGGLRSPILWFALAGLTAARCICDWPLADNHAYLISYWCLAIAISRVVRDGTDCLAFNGRLLIGLVFGLAVVWKLWLSPDFTDGSFIRVTMLRDPRFADWTQLSTGLTPDQIDDQRTALDRHFDAPPFEVEPAEPLPIRFERVADATTLWTIAIESAVALSFLWWRAGPLAAIRHWLLMAFCATTYAVATVEGFGWVLISMGVAQCRASQTATRSAYLACYALILFYREVPWERLLIAAVSEATSL